VYSAIADEVPVEALAERLRTLGKRTVYPVQAGDSLALAAVAARSALVSGPRGVLEPSRAAERVQVDEVDLFMVPGLLFDRSCRRLGRGGGHYDRLLRGAREDATLVGICYADRVIEELPEDPWDVAMDLVVTERFVLRRAPSGSAS
jgi:5-formyltetrahydrofolate cyclo-ligase